MQTRDVVRDARCIRIAERHARYVPDLERHFDLYFNAVVPHDEEGLAVVDYSEPRRHIYSLSKLPFLLSSLPEDEAMAEAYLRHFTGPWNLAFDVGAYCGLTSYVLSQRFTKVIAFEPDDENWKCLVDNVEGHGMSNVTVVKMVMASDCNGRGFFGEGSLGSRLALGDFNVAGAKPLPSVDLAMACTISGVPDFIAMDIEAAEIEVLKASRELLARERISLAIDTDHLMEGSRTTSNAVEAILRSCGYTTQTSEVSGSATTWAWKE